MSAPHADTGTAPQAAGRAAAVPVHRHVIQRLQAERAQAFGCFEYERVAELDAQIARLSAGTTRNPARETTSRPRVASRRKR